MGHPASIPSFEESAQGRLDRADEAAELLARLQEEMHARPVEALEVIARTCRNALRSGRRAKQVPQASFEAALALIGALAEGALEQR